MSAKRLYLVAILLLATGCQQSDISRDKGIPDDEAIAEHELGRQLKINRDTLLKGTSEQIRIDSATVMLFNSEPLARKILLEALKQSENITARVAVCKALSQAMASQEPIRQKDDFVQPLFDILNTQTDDSAKFAAEAILIFDYEQIARRLEKMVTDVTLPVKVRLNAIYALRLQPDMRAIFNLIDRLDDPDKEVVAAAEQALRFLGTPIGKSAEAREQIRTDLKRKGRDEFFRDLLIRQEAKMRDLQAESDRWRQRYLAVSAKVYDSISDDTVRGKFLADYLKDSEAPVRLWALEKVEQWRKGTNPQLPAELGLILVNLISDDSRDVRLKTANLLSLMGQLNSAEKLLEQLEAEQDNQVKVELFVALGSTCYYAFLPGSQIKIAPEIRKQTLEWAAKYLSEQDPENVQKGAEVIKKLLEQDGLTSADVDKYLDLLTQRYKQEEDESDGALRGELLNVMAGLCAQSVYKAESARRFTPLFEKALYDKTNLVREAAVDGLVYIDKARALKILRKDFVNDSSDIVRKKLIELAGEVGGQYDLTWLAEKIPATAESELAWQTMLRIFSRSQADILNQWLSRFDSQNTQDGLSDDQMLSFLEIAERKAAGENKPKMLQAVREKLALAYSKSGEFEQAAKYLGLLRQDARTEEQKQAISYKLLDVYLKWPNIELAVPLIANYLLKKDLEPDCPIVFSIDSYLSAPPAAADPNVLLEALIKIDAPNIQARPIWAGQLKRWANRLSPAKNTSKSQ